MNTLSKNINKAFNLSVIQLTIVLLGIVIFFLSPIFIIIWLDLLLLTIAFILSVFSLIRLYKAKKEEAGYKKWFSLIVSSLVFLAFTLFNFILFMNL